MVGSFQSVYHSNIDSPTISCTHKDSQSLDYRQYQHSLLKNESLELKIGALSTKKDVSIQSICCLIILTTCIPHIKSGVVWMRTQKPWKVCHQQRQHLMMISAKMSLTDSWKYAALCTIKKAWVGRYNTFYELQAFTAAFNQSTNILTLDLLSTVRLIAFVTVTESAIAWHVYNPPCEVRTGVNRSVLLNVEELTRVVLSTILPPLPLRRRLTPGPSHCISGVSEIFGPWLTVQVRLMVCPAMASLRPVTSIIRASSVEMWEESSDNYSSWLQIDNAQFCGSNRFSQTAKLWHDAHTKQSIYLLYPTEAECGYKHLFWNLEITQKSIHAG